MSKMFGNVLWHVRWIGGGSGAGKSTIGRHLAVRYGLGIYATDDVMLDHARRSTSEQAPRLSRFMKMGMDERWLGQSPEAMLDRFHWFRGEAFDLIVEDLLYQTSSEPGVIAEGFRLLPHLVAPLLADPGRAVWLLPTRNRTVYSGVVTSHSKLQYVADTDISPRTAVLSAPDDKTLFRVRNGVISSGEAVVADSSDDIRNYLTSCNDKLSPSKWRPEVSVSSTTTLPPAPVPNPTLSSRTGTRCGAAGDSAVYVLVPTSRLRRMGWGL